MIAIDKARLYYAAGTLAKRADMFLNREYFEPMIRQRINDDTLTWQAIDTYRLEAILLGVPEDQLNDITEEAMRKVIVFAS